MLGVEETMYSTNHGTYRQACPRIILRIVAAAGGAPSAEYDAARQVLPKLSREWSASSWKFGLGRWLIGSGLLVSGPWQPLRSNKRRNWRSMWVQPVSRKAFRIRTSASRRHSE